MAYQRKEAVIPSQVRPLIIVNSLVTGNLIELETKNLIEYEKLWNQFYLIIVSYNIKQTHPNRSEEKWLYEYIITLFNILI